MVAMPKLEIFAVRAAAFFCALAVIPVLLVPVIPAQDLGTAGPVVGVLMIVAVCIMHAIATKGVKDAVGFVVIAAFITWFVEFIGCNYGWWFGDYEYSDKLGFSIGNVPVMVVIAWEGIIYPSMIIVDDLLGRRAVSSRTKHLLHIALASLATGIVVTAWDFLADPISVHKGFWNWDNGGAYMPNLDGGIPFSNFGLMGWVGAVFMISFLYRIIYTNKDSVIVPGRNAVLMAAILYTAWFANAAYGLLHAGISDPGFHQPLMIGTFLMGSVLVLVWTRLLSGRIAGSADS